MLSEKVGFWEEQTKLKEEQIEEYDRLNIFEISRVNDLKAQIEKMKCCENCKHSYTDSENNVFCYLPFPQENCKSCKIYNHIDTDNDYWECIE